MDCYKEVISSDAHAIDADDKSMEVACSLTIPLLFGQSVEINIGIPNSAKPIRDTKSPWQINFLHGSQKVILEDIHFRSITTQTLGRRKFGVNPVELSNVKSLTMEMDYLSSSLGFLVYLSGTAFFDTLPPRDEQKGVSRISTFNHPVLGSIVLQKYSVESQLKNRSGSLKQNGYRLEVECTDSAIDHERIITNIQPLLDIISLLSRQRVLVYGWEKQTLKKFTRHWKYPLETIKTSYCLYEPQIYLVSHSQLDNMINAGLEKYYKLNLIEQDAVHKFSFALCSALERRNDVKYMALFSALESYAKNLISEPGLDDVSLKAIDLISEIAERQKSTCHDVYEKLKDLIKEIKRGSTAASSIVGLLSKYHVLTADLWAIKGKGGLLNIRNHLAHTGNHGIDHQGLAVATLHLTILIERVVLRMLNLNLEQSVLRELKTEPWVNLEYANQLKGVIIQK